MKVFALGFAEAFVAACVIGTLLRFMTQSAFLFGVGDLSVNVTCVCTVEPHPGLINRGHI